ncbi:diguanylate cyclase [Desulfosporosinus sp. Sb-LF]|uniref:GGDEF domain-containing protein n=1 Tax=Desulfosporosinus sp. Sb-LF TaxID=2560027 RepID=UPI00107F9F67|nr:diguanylate cyclase [Desulfosporosinus sp. Sb-LF]TGE31489.1 GGDEF domain-containing protein [Desulfosporosinus sp. Sb-LF]
MFKDLFLNATTIIAFFSLANRILINEEITPDSPWKIRIFFSSMSGILGMLLMIFSVQVMSGVILDFRNMAIILSATYCGLAPAIITGLIIGIFRLYYAGLTFSSMISALTAIIIGVGCGFISEINITKLHKWLFMTLVVLIIPCITLSIQINNHLLLIKTIFTYWFGLASVSVFIYFFVGYMDLLKSAYKKYQFDSSKDHRTGLNNVRQFDKEFNKIVNRLTENSMITMFFIDIDFFKKVNDVYGHQNGDRVLEELGKTLLSSTSSTDIVSRNGGEEFSVMMTDCPKDKVLEVAERIRKVVQEHKFYLIDGQIINITISIGVAIYPYTVKDIQEIVKKADLALYEAKRTGRNKVVIAKL